MKKVWIAAVLVAAGMALAMPALWAQRPDMTPEPEPAPAAASSALKPIVILEIRNVDELIKKFEAQIGSASPGYTPGALWEGIAGLVGAGTLSGVDRTGRLTIAVYNPQALETKTPLGLGVTVSSSEALLGGLATIMTRGQVEGDLHVFHKEKTAFDFEAFKAATPEERKDVSKFRKVEKHPVYVLLKGRLAVMSQSRTIVESMGGMQRTLERGLAVSDWVKDCDVLGKLDMQEGMRAIEPQIQQMTMLMSMAAAQGGATGAGDLGSPQSTMQIVMAEIQAVQAIAKQIEDVSLGVKLDEGDVVLRKSVKPMAGGTVADFLSKQKQHKPTFVNYAVGDSMCVAWGAVDDWSPVADAVAGFVKQIGAGADEGGAGLAKMFENMPNWLAVQRGESVMSAYPGSEGGFGVVQVAEFKDAAAGQKLLADTEAMLGAPFMAGMGLNFKKLDPETYEGIEIRRYQAEFGGEDMPAEAGEMIAKMYGPSPMSCYAIVDNKMVTSFGAGGLAAAKRAIDAVKGGKALGFRDTYKRLEKKLPPEGNALVFVSLKQLRNLIASMAGPAAAMIPEFPDEVIYAYGRISGGRVDAQLTVPAGFVKFIASQGK